MAGKKSEQGATGTTVAENIQRCRSNQRLGYAEMSRMLDEVGRSIPPLGLRRIESGERRVDVDDLVAIAAVLGVSPTTLMMPSTPNPDDEVVSSARPESVPAQRLWRWFCAERPLEGEVSASDLLDFAGAAFPEWRRIQYATGVRKLIELKRNEDGND